MTRYRNALPQLGKKLFLTDGGLETTLVFHEGLELPHFAAFHLLRSETGQAVMLHYFRRYADIARRFETGLVLETPTWRASADWGDLLGYSPAALVKANRQGVALLENVRSDYDSPQTPVVVSGCLGPRGDGYVPGQRMHVEEAQAYHQAQIDTFAGTGADMVCAMTLNYPEEAAGIALAARQADMPVALSFTVETDGRLPTGQHLGEAITQVDELSAHYPVYYMTNCAHPSHFDAVLQTPAPWQHRLRGLRANASCKSHAELDAATVLDTGDWLALGHEYAALCKRLPQLNVLGGCCGTDHRHIEQIARTCRPLFD